MGLNNWADLSPSAVTVEVDDTEAAWDVSVNGPLTEEDYGRGQYEVLGIPYLVVGPTQNAGQYSSIQDAINALEYSRHSGILILDGTYSLTAPIYLRDRDTEIKGESQGGVIIENNPGDDCFVLHNLTKTFKFLDFTANSQNDVTLSKLINISGDTVAENASKTTIDGLTLNLSATQNDIGVSAYKGSGFLGVNNCDIKNGYNGIYAVYQEGLSVNNNFIDAAKYYGIYTYGASEGNALISGNSVTNVVGVGIAVYAIGGRVANNTVEFSPTTFLSGDRDIGIHANGSRSVITGNSILCTMQIASTNDFYGIVVDYEADSTIVTGNKIVLGVSTPCRAAGLWLNTVDSVITGNKVILENLDHTQETWGLYSWDSTRNGINANSIEMRNDVQDIGFFIDTDSSLNHGSGNMTYNCGTSISDAGTNNSVSAMDI